MNELDQRIARGWQESDIDKLEWGAKKVHEGKADAVLMQCFNRDEVDTLQDYMAENHPDVPVYWEWVAPQPGGRELTGEVKSD